MNQNQSDMAKKSAISGEYIIQVEDSGSGVRAGWFMIPRFKRHNH